MDDTRSIAEASDDIQPLLALRGGLIEYLVEFYAAPPQARPAPLPDDPSRILASLGVREVASIPINSRAIEELLTTLLSTLLGALAGMPRYQCGWCGSPRNSFRSWRPRLRHFAP
jgi:hypothetical protein